MFKRVERLTDFDLKFLRHIKGLKELKRFEMPASHAVSWPNLLKDSNCTLLAGSFDHCSTILDELPFGIVSDGERQVLVQIDVVPPNDVTRFRQAEAHKAYGRISCLPEQCDDEMVAF